MSDSITFTLSGIDLTGVIAKDVRQKIGNLVAQTAEDVAADYKARITDNTGKNGRLYRRSEQHRRVKHDGKRAAQLRAMGLEEASPGKFIVGYSVHQASAPGQAPATDTGELAASVTVDESHAESDLYADVENSAAQALVLELGGEHVDARPALLPALQAAQQGFIDGIAAIVNGEGHA